MGLITRKVSVKTPIKYRPETKKELQIDIIELLKKGQTNLNCIDVSNVTDMSWLFNEIDDKVKVKDIDISEWDVSNVTDMIGMFFKCSEFDSDLSNWNVNADCITINMFYGCDRYEEKFKNIFAED